MANTNILQLPIAIGLDGSEYFPLTQGGTTKRCATGLLEQFTSGGSLQDANKVFAGPASGGAAAPSFRSLVADDLPTVPPTKGGTGFTSFTVGDLFYADTTTSLAKLADVATGNVLLSGGVGVAPAYGKVDAATHIIGVLPVVNGGTGNSALAALTKTDDTNVTLTLGGSPSTALVNAASIAVGWTGELSIARGGTGAATANAAFNALSPMTTNGDLITRVAGLAARLPAGAVGTALFSSGPGVSPAYGDPGFVSVLNPAYGVMADGVTDDTAAIQACIDANKGKTILFPAGNYLVGNSSASVTMIGSTYNGTRLVGAEGANIIMGIRPTGVSYNFQACWNAIALQQVYGCEVFNLSFNGQRTLQPVNEFCHTLVLCGVERCLVWSNQFYELRGDGIYLTQSQMTSSSTNSRYVQFYQNEFFNEAADGRNAISVAGCDDGICVGLQSYNVGGTLLYPLVATTCTISVATPAVVTKVAHGLAANTLISFDSTGTLPTGVLGSKTGQKYYVLATGLTADTFQFAATSGGTAINTSGAGSGTITYNTGTEVPEPGGFDCEPKPLEPWQSNKRWVCADFNITHEGTTGFAVHGCPGGTETTRDWVVDNIVLTNTAASDTLDGLTSTYTQNTNAGNFKLLWADNVTATNIICRFVNTYGIGPVVSDTVGARVQVSASKCYTGMGVGNQIYDDTATGNRGVQRSRIQLELNDISRFGLYTGNLSDVTITGTISGTSATYYSNRFAVILSTDGYTFTQSDVQYQVSVTPSVDWTRSYRANPGQIPPLTNVVIQNCDLGANDTSGWTAVINQIGDVEVPRYNVLGVTNRAAVPTGGSWTSGTFVAADGVPGVRGWLRSTSGSTNTAIDWLISGLDMMTVLSTDFTGTDVDTAQPVFAAAQDTFAASATTTYEFDAVYWIVRAAGTTSHTTSVLFGGTATFTSVEYLAQITNPTGNALANVQQIMGSGAGAVVLTAANTSATENVMVKLRGIIRINAAGTLIPQFQYSAAPGGAPSIKRNSYFRLKVMGTNTATIIGNWS